MSSETGSIAKAVRASTVILVRDNPSFQVLMVKRHENMSFAAGALVFPGGKVDLEDEVEGWENNVKGWHEVRVDQRALRIAAIREVFEETGLLVSLRAGQLDRGSDLLANAREALRS